MNISCDEDDTDKIVSAPPKPKHVAIIMDGNGRWAKKQGKLRIFGHRAGIKAVRRAVRFAVNQGIEVLTLYAFSSENWNRPEQEVAALMELFSWALDNEVKTLHKHQICLRVIGDVSRFSSKLRHRIEHAEQLTRENRRLVVNIAANYGGRWDIVQGVQKLVEKITMGELLPEHIDEHTLGQLICLHDLTPVDLVIRTGGEYRISNFLLWQIAYTELYFADVLWPDFDELVFEGALNAFAQRERRFGRTMPAQAEM